MISLGRDLIASMNGRKIPVKRSTQGEYVDGVYTDTTPAQVETQKLTFDIEPDSGDFTLSYGLNDFLVLWDATAQEIQDELNLVAGLEEITVSGDYTNGFLFNFIGVTGKPLKLAISDDALFFDVAPVTITQSTPTPWVLPTVFASVQPLGGKDLMRLPEGDRTAQRMKLYSADYMKTSEEVEASQADVVTIDGVEFQAESIETWPSYYKVIVKKIEPYTAAP